ncbi:MAG: YncE family protein, partial [Planctomycetaceae bacterium]
MTGLSLLMACVLAADAPQFAKPIRIVASGDAVFVANAKNGAVHTLDPTTLELRATRSIGTQLTDFASHPDGGFVAIDPVAETVVRLQASIGPPTTTLKVSRPERIAITDDGATAFVSSRWGKRVDVVSLNQDGLTFVRSTFLSFQPLLMAELPDKQIIVADAFGGQLAVLSSTGEL